MLPPIHSRSWRNLLGFAVSILATQAVLAKPANDDLADALEVTGTAFGLAADLQGATRELFEPLEANLNGTTAWWHWIAPVSGVYAWDSAASPKRSAVTVVDADGFAQRDVLAETYLRPIEGFPGLGVSVNPDPAGSFVAEAGRGYWLRVDGVRDPGFLIDFPGGNSGPFPVSISVRRLDGEPPVNDAFARRLVLTLATPGLDGTLALATAEPDEPPAHAASTGRTLWWEWTAPGRGTASVHFTTTNAVPLVAVYRRAPWSRLEAIASSATEYGNECTRFYHARDTVDFDTDSGETYFLQIDAFPDFDRSVPFRGTLTFVPAPANDLLTSPTELAGLDWTTVAANAGATGSPGDPQVPGQPGSSSIWYRWSLPGRGLVQITVGDPTVFAEPGVEILPPPGTGGGGVITVISTGPCGAAFVDLHPLPAFVPIFGVFERYGSVGDLPLLAYRSHGTNEVWLEIEGTELWFDMDGPQGVVGTASLNGHLTPPPANDARTNAIVLPSASVRVTGRSAGGTHENDEVLPEGSGMPPGVNRTPRRTVWWEWRAPSAGPWVLRPATGVGDHYFAAYRGDYQFGAVPAALTSWAPVLFRAEVGEVFRIGVFGVAGFGGNLEFRLVPATPPPLVPPRLESDGSGGLRWFFGVPLDWDLPFGVETSLDLRTWTPVAIDWVPGSEGFRVPFEGEEGARFLRLRVGEGVSGVGD